MVKNPSGTERRRVEISPDTSLAPDQVLLSKGCPCWHFLITPSRKGSYDACILSSIILLQLVHDLIGV